MLERIHRAFMREIDRLASLAASTMWLRAGRPLRPSVAGIQTHSYSL
ncbi:hypothetical protein ACWYXJ_00490 [Janthinobacterium lividum]|nr:MULTISPECIES: hypothetical protein [Janthinobacterium]QKY04115.1 hypothetical protein G3257_18855 [Janthinobacterium lividum]